jgi:hypothetical protein
VLPPSIALMESITLLHYSIVILHHSVDQLKRENAEKEEEEEHFNKNFDEFGEHLHSMV